MTARLKIIQAKHLGTGGITIDRVTHFHVLADDVDRAEKFYEGIFGWDVQDIGMENDYRLVTTANTDENGIPKARGGMLGSLCRI